MTPILADLLYTLSQHVLVSDHWAATLARISIAVLAALVASLRARLYLRSRGANVCWSLGVVATFAVVCWAQLIAVSTPDGPHDLTALNIGVLAAVIVSLVGTLQQMDLHLFKHSDPGPGVFAKTVDRLDAIAEAVEATKDEVTRGVVVAESNAEALDEINHAVNTRGGGQPT